MFEIGSSPDRQAPGAVHEGRRQPPSYLKGDDLLQWLEEEDILEAVRLSRLRPDSDHKTRGVGGARGSASSAPAPAPPRSISQKAVPIRRSHKRKEMSS